MGDNIDKTLRPSLRAWRWLWLFAIICCSLGIGLRLISGHLTWWDFLFPTAAIVVGAATLRARRISGFVLILFSIAVTTQQIHELVTCLTSR